MKTIVQSAFAGVALAAAFAVSTAAFAQSQTVRIRGPIQAVDGSTITVKAGEAGDVKVKLADNVAVFGVIKATLADIKPGVFIGVGATPQADGTQRAIQIMIFAETQRGTGEGHRPWDRPGTTMTNATVDTTVSGVDGQDELKPGANVMIVRATKNPDGTFGADRVNVGRDGIAP
jgi:hypothetical protein